LERGMDMVLDDVVKEKISIGRAKDAYGVVIDETSMQVDEGESLRLREERIADRQKS